MAEERAVPRRHVTAPHMAQSRYRARGNKTYRTYKTYKPCAQDCVEPRASDRMTPKAASPSILAQRARSAGQSPTSSRLWGIRR